MYFNRRINKPTVLATLVSGHQVQMSSLPFGEQQLSCEPAVPFRLGDVVARGGSLMAGPALATLSGVDIKRAAADWRQSQGGHTRQQNECECPHSASAPHYPERTNDHTPQNARKIGLREPQYLILT